MPGHFINIPVSFSFPGIAKAAFKMSTTPTASVDIHPPKSHHLFRFYDPELVAVLAILLGLFQMLLAPLTYSISTDLRFLFICPLCVGFVSVIAGSLCMASERIPRRQLLRTCLFAGLSSLVVALIALFLYGYAASNIPDLPSCLSSCDYIDVIFKNSYKAIYGQLIFYDVAALAVHCFLSFSAFQGLKTNNTSNTMNS